MKVCDRCGQLVPQARSKRICADCSVPIRRHDKWHIGTDGKLHHNDCTLPQGTPTVTQQTEFPDE